jgi:UDP-GlcNAc3NAcA epimerase
MKIATIVGARPQFIKASTVSRVIATREDISEVLIHTGQHFDKNMSDVFFQDLDIKAPDHHLGIGGGTHGQNTGRMLEAIENVLEVEKPDWVLVYGDTDSTLAGTLAAVKLHLRVAHVEAGLRSFNRFMPEEINRILTDHASDLLLVPTQTALINLEREGITGEKVCLVGDVMYDATLFYRKHARKPKIVNFDEGKPFTLCTIHRAENTDNPKRLLAIISLINKLAEQMPIVLPLHPRTLSAVNRMDGHHFSPEVKIIQPIGFLEMSWLLANCQFVLTDSGGLQKEAYFHHKQCVTLRAETEWVELVDAGWNCIINPTDGDVLSRIKEMYTKKTPQQISFFGDGNAARNIIEKICSHTTIL